MAEKFEVIKISLNQSLNDKEKPWKKAFDLAEEKTSVPRLYLFLAIAGFVALYLMFGAAAQLLCNIISVAYPAYISMKALETSTKEDDTKWLTYWVLYAVFSVLEFFTGYLYAVIPFYFLLKCVFFIWCMLPISNNGATVVYQKVIRPHFLKHQTTADEALHKLADKAKEIVSDVSDVLKKSK